MRKLLTFLPFILFFLPLKAEVINIDNVELKRLIEAGVPIIDVRRPEEWRQTGVVQGSHLMTFFDSKGNYDLAAWMDKLSKITGPDDPFILICRTGNRTGTISRFLDKKLAYHKVHNVTKGITDWISEGNTTVPPNL